MIDNLDLYIEKQVDRYYSKIGIKRSLSGSLYLIEALKLSINDDSLINRHLTTKLYPLIADKYNVSALQVERAIRNLINYCYNNNLVYTALFSIAHTTPAVLNQYYKPSNGELISLCHWKLKIKLQEEGYL